MITELDHINALGHLNSFIHNGLKDYSKKRNFDFGEDNRSNVSELSPFIKKRIIHEKTVISNCLDTFKLDSIEKFIQEVFWRTYWRGWLEGRPKVWKDYLRDLGILKKNLNKSNFYKDYKKAIDGQTGFDCFDHWVGELQKSGYLHNHARMWFASIWIFTLNLPWQLGADLFYKNLLDADAASNTLSWRWVAGLQTKGKIYLAREDNIEKYSKFSFTKKNTLAQTAKEPEYEFYEYEEFKYPNTKLNKNDYYLINPNYLLYDKSLLIDLQYANVINYNHLNYNEDTIIKQKFNTSAVDEYVKWLKKNNIVVKEIFNEEKLKFTLSDKSLFTHYPGVGYENDKLIEISKSHNISINYLYDSYDTLCWPYAKSGFFKFKTKINHFIQELFNYQK